jgi:hypothetical protein
MSLIHIAKKYYYTQLEYLFKAVAFRKPYLVYLSLNDKMASKGEVTIRWYARYVANVSIDGRIYPYKGSTKIYGRRYHTIIFEAINKKGTIKNTIDVYFGAHSIKEMDTEIVSINGSDIKAEQFKSRELYYARSTINERSILMVPKYYIGKLNATLGNPELYKLGKTKEIYWDKKIDKSITK